MKHIKILGLLAVAAMAVAAFVGTTAASAEIPGAFTTNKTNKKIETIKVTEHTFTITGSNVNCNKISFAGFSPATETSREATATPKYEECTAFGFANATVDTEGCHYTFTDTTTGNPASTSETHASVHLSTCTKGGATITVNIPFIAKCKVFIPNQEIKDAVHYENKTTGTMTTVQVNATAKTIEAKVQESTGSCPLTVATHTNASYTGSQLVEVVEGNISYDKDHTP